MKEITLRSIMSGSLRNHRIIRRRSYHETRISVICADDAIIQYVQVLGNKVIRIHCAVTVIQAGTKRWLHDFTITESWLLHWQDG